MLVDRPTGASVVIVDDSPVQRRFLRAALEGEPDFTVVGEAHNGREAVALVARLLPNVVLMDLNLPIMSGIEAIERIMSENPTPILVYSAFVGDTHHDNFLEALAAGAVDVLAKPGLDNLQTRDEQAEEVRRKLRVAVRVRVITHPRGRWKKQAGTAAPPVGQASSAPALAVAPSSPTSPPTPLPTHGRRRSSGTVKLVVIGASTGGPQALLALLGQLPVGLSQAVLVVQHMADGFISGLASWLDGLVPMPVLVGQSGCRLMPGTITLAPIGGNLLVLDEHLWVRCVPPEPGQFHLPSIDVTFTSVAEALGPNAVGVVLTGMGRDGAVGLLAMRKRGAFTIGQDEATSAVYGMPAAAFALSAVERQLPLAQIAPAVLVALGRSVA